MANSTVSHLKLCLPGQPESWYQRIATEITAGRMPLPSLPAPEPIAAVEVEQPKISKLPQVLPPPAPEPEPIAAVEVEPPTTRNLPQVLPAPPAPEPIAAVEVEQPKPFAKPAPPAPKSPVPLQASQHQLEQAAKSARAKAPQSKPKQSKTHPPRALITLLRGDYAGADRLFLKVQLLNPGRDERWVWDKVLWDLHRDRM